MPLCSFFPAHPASLAAAGDSSASSSSPSSSSSSCCPAVSDDLGEGRRRRAVEGSAAAAGAGRTESHALGAPSHVNREAAALRRHDEVGSRLLLALSLSTPPSSVTFSRSAGFFYARGRPQCCRLHYSASRRPRELRSTVVRRERARARGGKQEALLRVRVVQQVAARAVSAETAKLGSFF